MIKFLIFSFLGFLVYRVFVKPLFVQSQPNFFGQQQQNPMGAMQEMLQRMMEQQQQNASNGRSTPRQQTNHDDEYIDYEEVK